ncbi:hypothetical protein AALB19_03140 [Oscillospiraceae bacterium 50-58]
MSKSGLSKEKQAGRKKKRAVSPKLTAKQAKLAQVEREIAKLSAAAVSPEQIDTISNCLDDWENASFEDKQQVVDLMITVICATSGKLQIEWKLYLSVASPLP